MWKCSKNAFKYPKNEAKGLAHKKLRFRKDLKMAKGKYTTQALNAITEICTFHQNIILSKAICFKA